MMFTQQVSDTQLVTPQSSQETPISETNKNADSKTAELQTASAPANARPGNAAWKHLTATIRPSLLAECQLLLLTILTGMQDAVTFPDYHCFASNQTGNTVFLMLAIVLPSLNGDMFFASNIGTALGFFLAGGWLTGQLGHIIGPRCRLWLLTCNLVQACMVFAAGAIQHMHTIELNDARALVVIALLAFASGSQVVQSRTLGMTEISTAMATAAWVDLLIDPRLFALHNRPRTRRAIFLVALVVGALLGALIYRSVGSSVVVLVSAGGKALVAFMYLFNEEEKPKLNDEKV